jgi:predicted Zn-ribbon and HTH transcriptional regulator
MRELPTIPQQLRLALAEAEPKTLRLLSGELGVAERDLIDALAKLERSLQRGPDRFELDPASCLACGHEFADRRRLTAPGRCPSCGSERIRPPRFRVLPAGSGASPSAARVVGGARDQRAARRPKSR